MEHMTTTRCELCGRVDLCNSCLGVPFDGVAIAPGRERLIDGYLFKNHGPSPVYLYHNQDTLMAIADKKSILSYAPPCLARI